MIYLFHGTDVEKARAKAFAWVAAARAKEPNLAYVRLAREEMTPAALEDAAASGGLFVKRLLVVLDDPFPAARVSEEEAPVQETSTDLEDRLEALAASDNAIVILAPKLSAPRTKKLLKHAKLEYQFDKKTVVAARGFNSGLVNALAARNGAKLWAEIERALRAGDAPEMLHGLLHWKARDLMQKGARGWTKEEARAVSRELIELLQMSRRGGLGLALGLERWALSI